MPKNKEIVLFDDVFFTSALSGITKYWQNILDHMNQSSINGELPFELVMLNRSDKLKSLSFRQIDFPKWDVRLPAAERKNLALIAQEIGAKSFVSSYDTFCPGVPNIRIAYDLIPEVFGFSKKDRTWMERALTLLNADFIVPISNSTKQDLKKFYPSLGEVISDIAYPGISSNTFYRRNTQEIAELKAKHRIGNYILYVGTRVGEGGYKNGKLLFDLLSISKPKDFDVVLVGGEPLSPLEKNVINKSGHLVRHLAPADDELGVILSGADALIHTSLYEGFGMPVLEALACGTPVISTETSSLVEASGGLSVFISGGNAEELYAAITTCRQSEWKEKISREGPVHASKFEWKNSAEIISRVIEKSLSYDRKNRIEFHNAISAYDDLARLTQK